MSGASGADGASGHARPPLEIGVLIAGPVPARERRLARRAAARLADELARRFPRFDWRVDAVVRPDLVDGRREGSSALLRLAAEERDAASWDLALMVVAGELVARYRSFALAALSRPLDAAVVSTARLVADPERDASAEGAEPGDADRGAATDDGVVIGRLATLLLHAVAHLGGASAARDPDALLYRPVVPGDLDRMTALSDAERTELDAAFADIADARLEETAAVAAGRSAARFATRAAWINREVIVEAVLAARPWEFPRRLSRLTTAAVSTVAILLMTAESWDLGLSQDGATLGALALLALGFTSAFVTSRQGLLLGRARRAREQLVVTEVSAVAIVVAGLATTWAGMFALAWLATTALFDPALVIAWAGSVGLAETDVGAATSAKMSTWCASLGLLIGSLGASFEDQQHFQHVIFVDEEL